MSFRFRYQGDPALASVAAAVIERMARDAGLHDEEARDFADATRTACERVHVGAGSADLATAPRAARVRIRVRDGEPPGSVQIEVDAREPRPRRRTRRA